MISDLRYFNHGFAFIAFAPDLASFDRDWFSRTYAKGYRTLRFCFADHTTADPSIPNFDPISRFVNTALAHDFRVFVEPEITRAGCHNLWMDCVAGNYGRADAFFTAWAKWLSLYPESHVAMNLLTEPKWHLTEATGDNQQKLIQSSQVLENWQRHILGVLRPILPLHLLGLGFPGTGAICGVTNGHPVGEFGALTPVGDDNTYIFCHPYVFPQFLNAVPGTRHWPSGVPSDQTERYNAEGKPLNIDSLRFFFKRLNDQCNAWGKKWVASECGPVTNAGAPEGIAYSNDLNTVLSELGAGGCFWQKDPLASPPNL